MKYHPKRYRVNSLGGDLRIVYRHESLALGFRQGTFNIPDVALDQLLGLSANLFILRRQLNANAGIRTSANMAILLSLLLS